MACDLGKRRNGGLGSCYYRPLVAGDRGASTPANVDIHDTGQADNPQAEWGEPADEGAVFSSNNTRKGVRTD